jgi:CRP/FNR family transcriptional activator FtrB
MRAFDAEQIRSVHLFREMADAHFASLMKAAFLQRFPAHVVLINETEKPDFLHVVVEGGVELFSPHDGRETTITIIRPVTTFILAAVVGDLPYLASGRTLEASRILMIPAEAVRSVFDQEAAFARAVVWELSRAFRGVMKELKNQKLRTSIERLANWMLLANAQNGGRGHFTIPFDKHTLASRLGMTPENLSRNLAALGDYGVTVCGREVRLKDIPRLTTLAKPAAAIDDPDY